MMKETISRGMDKHVIINLHGTGGTATSLFELAHFLDPESTKIGFQGEVNENGMSRYFARYPDGSFDLLSLAKATQDLYESIRESLKKNSLEDAMVTIIGYSNGANLAKNLLKEYTDLPVDTILLFHPSQVTPDKGFKKQANLRVLMTAGKKDPYVTESEFMQIKTSMAAASIKVETVIRDQGHQITQEELNDAKSFLSMKMEDVQ